MFRVEHANHLASFNNEQRRRSNRGRRCHANRLTGHDSLTNKVTWPQNRQNGLFANLIDNGELYAPFLNVHHTASGFTLRKDLLRALIFHYFSGDAGRIQENLGIEGMFLRGFSFGFNVVCTRDLSTA